MAEELESPAGLSKDFQQLALTKMTIKDIKFIVFDLHFFASHILRAALFSMHKKRLILQLEELKQQWEIKLSSGNIFSSLLNNVELINWVELVNVTRVNVLCQCKISVLYVTLNNVL